MGQRTITTIRTRIQSTKDDAKTRTPSNHFRDENRGSHKPTHLGIWYCDAVQVVLIKGVKKFDLSCSSQLFKCIEYPFLAKVTHNQTVCV